MKRHRAFVRITSESLARFLHLSGRVEIVGVQQDIATDSFDVFLEGPDLPEANSGYPLQRVPLSQVLEFEK